MAVSLKPMQQLNKELDQKKNIPRAAGLLAADSDIEEDGRTVEEMLTSTYGRLTLDSGEYTDGKTLKAMTQLAQQRTALCP